MIKDIYYRKEEVSLHSEPIRAAVISDTHGLLRPEVEQVIGTCDAVIHAGDFDNQMLYHKLNIKQPLYAVRGNNDGTWAAQLPLVKRFSLGGVKLIMAHERQDIPAALGQEQIVIFGHSHMYCQKEEEGRLWLNPGSCGYRRFTLPLSLAVLTLQDGAYEVETIWLEKGGKKPEEGQNGEEQNAEGPRGREKDGQGQPAHKEKQSLKKQREKDQLFLIAKIMRLMKRGESISWVAKNIKSEPAFVEMIYRICVTHPGADARQILDKLEVNRLYSDD